MIPLLSPLPAWVAGAAFVAVAAPPDTTTMRLLLSSAHPDTILVHRHSLLIRAVVVDTLHRPAPATRGGR